MRAKLKQLPENIIRQPLGTFRCNSKHGCKTCRYIEDGTTSITFTTTGEQRTIKQHLTCATPNVIYLIHCKKSSLQYIGETGRKARARFGDHRRGTCNLHNDPHEAVPCHFRQPGHSDTDILFVPMEQLRSNRVFVRRAREAHLIERAGTIEPYGINRREEE